MYKRNADGTFRRKEETKTVKPICMICDEEGVNLSCKHAVCMDCLINYCKSKIDSRWTTISCPAVRCGSFFGNEVLSDIFRGEWDKYQQKMSSIALERDPSYIFCPTPDCGYCGFTGGKDACAECPKCEQTLCMSCKEKSHPGRGCHQTGDIETFTYKMTNTKGCPKCNFHIEKNGGCVHISCENCKYQFCWECLGHWTHSHLCPVQKSKREILQELNARLQFAKAALAPKNEELMEAMGRFEIDRAERHISEYSAIQHDIREIEKRIAANMPVPMTPFQMIARASYDLSLRRQRGDPTTSPILLQNLPLMRLILDAIKNMKMAISDDTYQNSDIMKVLAGVGDPRLQYMLSHYVPLYVILIRDNSKIVTTFQYQMQDDLPVPDPLPESFRVR